ncbi:hypothetical protein NOVO_01665 [Rickettsiales bacterium Ac37b]|nr:hypothetical protein NOVO_01665 [Rickettsiales bacterium Ac37b]
MNLITLFVYFSIVGAISASFSLFKMRHVVLDLYDSILVLIVTLIAKEIL